MPFQSKDSKGQLFDQINAENPTLPAPLSSADFNLSAVKVIPPKTGSIINSEIGLFAKVIGLFRKYVFVRYRRLDFQTMFRSNMPVIHQYSPAAANASPFTVYQLLPYLNKRYGVNITADDVSDVAFPVGNTTTSAYLGQLTSVVTVKAKSTSLGYTNQFDLRWVAAKQQLSDILPNTDLDGREYPGGNDFDNPHPSVLNSDSFGVNFLNVVSSLTAAGAFDGSHVLGDPAVIAAQHAVFDEFNSQRGTNYTITAANVGNQDNLYGATLATYVLPNAAVPEANSVYYNRCVVVTPASSNAGANVSGKLILHYNV